MNITITLETKKISNIKEYYSLFENLDKKGYIVSIENKTIYIEQNIDNIQKDIENTLLIFLKNIDIEFLKENSQELRVGIFYSLNELAFLSVKFSNNLIKLLSNYTLEVEINSYLY
jgi:hypothetical protein